MTDRDDWDLSPPPASPLSDHDVPADGDQLAGRRVALLVTGGIAAYKTPTLARALRRRGADVVVFATTEALRYVAADALAWASVNPVVTELSAEAEHLSDSRPFDAYLVAPATYNTINKLAAGIADTPVTATLASALGRQARGETALLVAPTMHGTLHNPVLTASLERLRSLGVRLVPPRQDYGKHNLPSEEVLVAEVARTVSRSPLAGVPVLVTGGPTPVPIDGVRRIVNRFRGRLGALVAEDLYLRGADVTLVHGDGAYQPPDYLPVTVARTYDDYRRLVGEVLAARPHTFGVFSAAVADYRPREARGGKTPSGEPSWVLDLMPTPKVIDEVRERFPDLYMVVFKYQEGVSQEELTAVARERLARGFPALVANRGEEMGAGDEHTAYLFTSGAPDALPQRLTGKGAIARGIVDHLESVVRARAVAAADAADTADTADATDAADARAARATAEVAPDR